MIWRRAAPLLHELEQVAWFDRLDEEQANLGVALAWLLATGEVTGALRLATSLYQFWYVRGYFGEGFTWLNRVLRAAAPPDDVRTAQIPRCADGRPSAPRGSPLHTNAGRPAHGIRSTGSAARRPAGAG